MLTEQLDRWRCSSVGRASDQHTTGAGLIPWCGKGFFSRVNFHCRLSYGVHTPSCAMACIKLCAHVKDPVVHVRVWWIVETLKDPACTVGRVERLCCSWLPQGKQPEFAMGEIPKGQQSCKNERKKLNEAWK